MPERRYYTDTVQIETRDDQPSAIVGTAAVFYRADDPGTEYQLTSRYVERILPTAFDRALEDGDDVAALFNHDSGALLGRSSAGTLQLWKSDRGLEYRIAIDPDDPDHQRVARKISRGDLKGSSFAFSLRGGGLGVDHAMSQADDGSHIRSILSVRLYDVGPVTYPAYSATSTSMRAGDMAPALDELAALLRQRREQRLRQARLREIEIDALTAK